MEREYRKILIPSYIGVITTAFTFATQYVAHELNYQDALYGAIYTASTFKIYFPFSFIFWWNDYGTMAKGLFKQGFNIITFTVLFMTGISLWIISILKKGKTTDNFGSAGWATLKDLKDTTLLTGKGTFLSVFESGEYLRDDDKTHIFVAAPTRSGKGVGIIIPSLLYWQGSVIVLDIKGENYDETAGWRKEKMNNIVLKFKPTEEDSARYNPLDEIRKGTPREVQDTQNIVMYFVDPTGKGSTGSEAHWIQSAASLMTGIILHLLYTMDRPSIKDVLNFMSDTSDVQDLEENYDDDDDDDDDDEDNNNGLISFQEKLTLILAYAQNGTIYHDNTGKILQQSCCTKEKITFHPMVKQIFTKMASTPEKEFGSIVSTLDTVLNVYRDPILANNLSVSDFSMNDLMHNDKPVSLYLIFPPSDIERIMPICRLIIELAYRRNVEKLSADYKNRLLMILDEFPSIGKMELLEKALAYIAGYGIKAMIITQDLTQLYKEYTQNNSIVSNCHVRVYFTPNELTTAKYLSELLGKKTVETKSKSFRNTFLNIGPNSINHSETGRCLMHPDEIMQFPDTDSMIFVAGKPPIRAKKIRWYDNSHFITRKLPSPSTDRIIRETDNWREAFLKNIKDAAEVTSNEMPAAEEVEIEEPAEDNTPIEDFSKDIFEILEIESEKNNENNNKLS